MKIGDLISLCMKNLMRRKLRTALTVLGVLVGCTSIVVMLSIGIGMKEAQEKLVSQLGDLNIITVFQQGNDIKLDDDAILAMQKIDGVLIASPKYESDISVVLYVGDKERYRCEYPTIVGMSKEAYEELGYELLDGKYLSGGNTALVGQYFAYGFSDTKRPEGYNTIDYYSFSGEEMPDAYFEPLKSSIKMEISVENSNDKIIESFDTVGVIKEDYSKGYETSSGLMLDIKELRKIIEKANRISSKKIKDFTYSSVIVKAENLAMVGEIEEKIKAMGFSTYSMESIRKPMEEEARQKQMMLGGLGAISLFVAALGITNTMIMSITERTREIGVMKALGCFVGNIRTVFLMEAACIGFIGGVLGIILSEIISFIMNTTSVGNINEYADYMSEATKISVIPVWLLIFALVFSVIVGIISGLYPANKAVKISALEAIKYE